jgi:hypothetical protein
MKNAMTSEALMLAIAIAINMFAEPKWIRDAATVSAVSINSVISTLRTTSGGRRGGDRSAARHEHGLQRRMAVSVGVVGVRTHHGTR